MTHHCKALVQFQIEILNQQHAAYYQQRVEEMYMHISKPQLQYFEQIKHDKQALFQWLQILLQEQQQQQELYGPEQTKLSLEQEQLSIVYAMLLLHDADMGIDLEKVKRILQASNIAVSVYAKLFVDRLSHRVPALMQQAIHTGCSGVAVVPPKQTIAYGPAQEKPRESKKYGMDREVQEYGIDEFDGFASLF